MKGFPQFLVMSFIVFQMVTKLENYVAHHAGGFTIVGKGRNDWSDHKAHTCTARLKTVKS